MKRRRDTRAARGPYDRRWWRRRANPDEPEHPLRLARLEQRHTQQQAADLIGIKRARLCRIENGSLAPPDRFSDYNAAEAYKAYVAAGTPAPPPKPPRGSRRRR